MISVSGSRDPNHINPYLASTHDKDILVLDLPGKNQGTTTLNFREIGDHVQRLCATIRLKKFPEG